MREQDWKRWLERLQELSPGQRQALMAQLLSPDERQQVLALIDRVGESAVICPHCAGQRVVRNGQADGLQRYKCRGCGKTFNALTATPLARLRQRHKWLAQARVLDEGLIVRQAAERLQVAPSTAFRWRHRFLRLAQQAKSALLSGIAEADETFILRSAKGQQVCGRAPRRRGGHSSTRGTSDDHVPVLVARDRSGSCTDFILERCSKREILASLAPVLATDAVLCTDGSSAMAAAASAMGIEHHVLNMSTSARVQGAWHIQNVNAYHSRLKGWIRRFRGVATSYLHHYLGWFRIVDRCAPGHLPPAQLLNLSLGRFDRP
jgi:transposase-like protein